MTSVLQRLRGSIEARIGATLPEGATAAFALRSAHLMLELLCLLLMARLLSASAFGVYALAMTCVTLLGVPAAAGFDRLLVREVAANLVAERWGLLRGVLRRATQVALISSALLALGLAVVAVVVVQDEALGGALLLAALCLPLVAFARMRQAAMQGLGHVSQGIFTETIVQPTAVLLFAILLFTGFGLPRSGANAVALQIAAALVAMSAGIWLLNRLWPPSARLAPVEYHTSRWLGSAAPMMWMMGMNMLLTSADTLMLGWMLDEAAAGQYRVASQVAMLVTFPMAAINLVVAPALARSYATGNRDELRQHASRAARWSLLAALPVALALLFAGQFVLGIFGSQFTGAWQPLLILSLGYVVNSFTGAAGYVLIMTRHERLAAWTFTAAALTNLLANYLLIPALGLSGAAWATAGSVSLVSLGLGFFARRLVVSRQ